MDTDFTQSILLITSQDEDNHAHGTGFAVYRDSQGTYVVTCAHVVDDLGGIEQIGIYGQPAEVIAHGERTLLDLAVLRVAGLFERPLLPLCAPGGTGDAITLAGYQIFSKNYLIRPLQGSLGAEGGLELPQRANRIATWDVTIDDPNFDIQPGYSGSPVIHRAQGGVLGVMSYKLRAEKQGLAISIAALKALWPDMPATLFVPAPETVPAASPAPSAFVAIKRKTLEANLADLCHKYELAHAQIRGTLSVVDKATLQNQIRLIEHEIADLETQLQQL